MKKTLYTVILLLLGFYGFAQTIKTTSFEVTFPAQPQEVEQDIVTEAGDTHVKTYQLLHEGAMLLISEATYQEGVNLTTSMDVTKKILKNSKNGSVNNFAGQMGLTVTLVSEIFEEYQTLLAMRSVDKVGNYFAQVYTLVDKNKLYSIMVFSETERQGRTLLYELTNSFLLVTP
jgi:hypothetical protein